MNGPLEVLFFPKALQDLQRLDTKFTRQILEDCTLLTSLPWPAGKTKRLHGTTLWELKTGDFRTLFLREGARVVVARVVNRRDLTIVIHRFDANYVLDWLREKGSE